METPMTERIGDSLPRARNLRQLLTVEEVATLLKVTPPVGSTNIRADAVWAKTDRLPVT